MPYWIVDAIKKPGIGGLDDPCNDQGMYIRGVEIDMSISTKASPDWRHTKWDISHTGSEFDKETLFFCLIFHEKSSKIFSKTIT